MAVRQLHMHDGGIVERRLRPIYDWLDNGNNKKALQEAEKVLKKSPCLQAARALKAVALLRLGKGSQAHALLDELSAENLSDDTTLQAMTISYRESQQLHKVCALYETAVKLDPTSEELYSHLFMSYVRVADFKSQQRSAMALYKFAPKNPYYFWAVMSIVLQAKAEEQPKKGILLALAQRMVDNFISENKIEAEQEVRLYIMILELQEKWEALVKFIETPVYTSLVPGSIAQASIPYLKKLGQWKRLNLVCKELLWDNQDRWDYYLPYFDSAFELMKGSVSDSSDENSPDDTPEKCHEFICQLVESMSSGRTLRGPYLARLELWKRLSKDGDPTAILGSGVALCVQYLRVFGHKPCAVPDLRIYIGMLPQKEREEHSRDFLTCLGFDENSKPDNADDIQRHVSCLSAWRLAGATPGRDGVGQKAGTESIEGRGESWLAAARSLQDHYIRSLREGLVTASLTEFCAADGYGTLAAHHYFNAAMELQSSSAVVEALTLLELVLHHSPANFHAKLLLLTLYHLLGNALAADTIYQRLEIKHVQLVSLGWLHAARLAPGCAPSRALQLLADTRAFYAHHAKDCVEHLTYAYKYGTFEKLVELRAWSARLEACGSGAGAARARALLAPLAGPAAPLHAPPPLPANPRDNRDLEVIVNFEPPEQRDQLLKERTFDQGLAWLRLQDGLVSGLALCIELSDSRTVEEKTPHHEELKTCVNAFSEAMKMCKEKYSAKEKISISAPAPCRIIAFVSSVVPYRELYSESLLLVGELACGPGTALQARCQRLNDAIAAAPALLAKDMDIKCRDVIWTMREKLEALANYLEFIGIMTFLLGVCNELVAPENAKKSKKKTNQSPDDIRNISMLNKLNKTVQNSITTIETIVENLPKYDYTTLDEDFAQLSLLDYQNPVQQKLKDGRQEMINDVHNILKKKTKYLKTLIH